MKWLLLIFVVTGEHHNFIAIEFTDQNKCIVARDWVISVDQYHKKTATPKAECFNLK